MRFRTKQIRGGVKPDPTTGALLTPIHQSTTFAQPSVADYLATGYAYSRSANPTVRALEEKMALLEEGADAAAFSSGMAAINTVLAAILGAGDHAVVSDAVYGGTHRLCTRVFARFGVDFSFVDTADAAVVDQVIRDDTRLVLIETPANPTLKLTDIAAVSQVAREHDVVMAVDNTFLTPYYQLPLQLGADLSIHSTTKYLDGHNATVGGTVVSASADLHDRIAFVQKTTGVIMSPFVAWLTMQGIKTLAERMDRQSANALHIARFLKDHPRVTRVQHPGLESFPQHDLAKRQASGFGAMIWFEVAGGLEGGTKVMDSVSLWSLAENLGSVESLITHPVTMTHADMSPDERRQAGISDGMIRLSVGLEDVEDLIEDLGQALAAD